MKRLYRSSNDRIVSGVLGGIAEYFKLDPTIIRLAFVVALIFGVGTPIFIYIAAIFIMPNEWEVR